MMHEKVNPVMALLEQVQKSGQAMEILQKLLDDNIFDDLSKHNVFWHDSDKLDDLRMKLSWFQDEIIAAKSMLIVDPYEA